MIRRDYGNISGAQRIEFGFAKVSGGTAVVQVFVREANGSVRAFLYSLIAEGDSWKISGVQPQRSGFRRAGLHI
jgi:hypothetical protein